MAEEEASEKALTIIAKIKAKQWKAMGKTVEQMKEFADSGGLESLGAEFAETLSLQVQDALSPLLNEVTTAVNEALAPIMPEIVILMTGVTDQLVLAVKSWEAILTGNWDDFFAWMNKTATDDMKTLKNNIRQYFDDMFSGKMGRDLMAGWEGFWTDVGAGWEGFWRDVGWR